MTALSRNKALLSQQTRPRSQWQVTDPLVRWLSNRLPILKASATLCSNLSRSIHTKAQTVSALPLRSTYFPLSSSSQGLGCGQKLQTTKLKFDKLRPAALLSGFREPRTSSKNSSSKGRMSFASFIFRCRRGLTNRDISYTVLSKNSRAHRFPSMTRLAVQADPGNEEHQ